MVSFLGLSVRGFPLAARSSEPSSFSAFPIRLCGGQRFTSFSRYQTETWRFFCHSWSR